MKSQVAEARQDVMFGLMDAVHEASFRGGLANSILCKDELIGTHSTDAMKVCACSAASTTCPISLAFDNFHRNFGKHVSLPKTW